jgi:hypothetical protein
LKIKTLDNADYLRGRLPARNTKAGNTLTLGEFANDSQMFRFFTD